MSHFASIEYRTDSDTEEYSSEPALMILRPALEWDLNLWCFGPT